MSFNGCKCLIIWMCLEPLLRACSESSEQFWVRRAQCCCTHAVTIVWLGVTVVKELHVQKCLTLLTSQPSDSPPLQSSSQKTALPAHICRQFLLFHNSSSSIQLFFFLSSALTFLSRCGSGSQCKGPAVPGSPCVCLHSSCCTAALPPPHPAFL